MDGLIELVKQISISRSVTGASFVTAIATLLGHRWAPTMVQAPPKEWVPIATGIAIFSGALLLFWLVAGSWRLCVSATQAFGRRRRRSARLSSQEYAFLELVSTREDETLDLNQINYQAGKVSKLEVHDLVDRLAERELLYRNMFGENLVVLTTEGRRAVLSVRREIASGARSQLLPKGGAGNA